MTNYSGWPHANNGAALEVKVCLWNIRDDVRTVQVDTSRPMSQVAEEIALHEFGVARGNRSGTFTFARLRNGVDVGVGTEDAPIAEGAVLTLLDPPGHGG